MAMSESEPGYKAEADFEEDTKEHLIEIDVNDSTELWLIQWPINQLQPADFHGKELSLKLHRDGRLASFESSSGKSYDMVSSTAQEPNATVFVASASGSKVVGRISRRVCLVHYPEPDELDKPGLSGLNVGSQRSEDIKSSSLRASGSARRSMSHRSSASFRHGSHQGNDGVSHDTLTSTHSIGQRSEDSKLQPRKKRRADYATASDMSMRSADRSSRGTESDTHTMNTSLGPELSHGGKAKKKRKINEEE